MANPCSFIGTCRGGPRDGQCWEHASSTWRVMQGPRFAAIGDGTASVDVVVMGEYRYERAVWVWCPENGTSPISAENAIARALDIDDHYNRAAFLQAWNTGDWAAVRSFLTPNLSQVKPELAR